MGISQSMNWFQVPLGQLRIQKKKKSPTPDFRLFNNRKEIFFNNYFKILQGGGHNVGMPQMGEDAFNNKLIPKENPRFGDYF